MYYNKLPSEEIRISLSKIPIPPKKFCAPNFSVTKGNLLVPRRDLDRDLVRTSRLLRTHVSIRRGTGRIPNPGFLGFRLELYISEKYNNDYYKIYIFTVVIKDTNKIGIQIEN